MNGNRRGTHSRGFSLIEVLVAVAVLAFGLLALASLQTGLIRSSSESKAQTVALSLAKDKIENLRDYASIAAYQAIDSGNDVISDVNGSTGGVNFTRAWEVKRYAFNKTTKVFDLLGTNTGALSAGYATNNEFKRVKIAVNWTDAAGAAQTTAIEDAISATDPTDSARLAKMINGSAPRQPEVLISDPALTNGVIPIAIGNGSNTAATNPTPEVVGRGTTNQQIVETRFNVLTYAGLNGGTATEQSRVETAVAGCLCDATTGGGSPGLRPTFWDGKRYTPPLPANFAPPAGTAVLTSTDPAQSRLCTICCRDHHDNSSTNSSRIGSGEAKFDPRRTTHDHYDVTYDSSGNRVFTLATGRYEEACRIIRVDGIFRVAADPYNDHMDLLTTRSQATSNVPNDSTAVLPTTTASNNYAGKSDGSIVGFVKNYMIDRFVNGTSYNTQTAIAIPSPAVHNTTEAISKSPIDFRWMHVRGLYVDYLEPAAITAINTAKTSCDAQNTATPNSCNKTATVLSMLPFTSINLTEIANWASFGDKNTSSSAYTVSPTTDTWATPGTAIAAVTNDDFLEAADYDINYTQPVRGSVVPGFSIPINPASGTYYGNIISQILGSASGLALLTDPLDPCDSTHLDGDCTRQDNQPYTIGPSGIASAAAGNYTICIANTTNCKPTSYVFAASSASYPRFSSTPNTSRCTYATRGGTKPNPYSCGAYTLGVAMNLTISKYNYVDTSQTSTTPLTCTGAEGNRTYNGPYPVNTCKNYGLVSSFPVLKTGSGTAGTPIVSNSGMIGEYTTVPFTNVSNGDTIALPLQLETQVQTGATCTYQVSTASNGTKSYTYFTVPDACP